MTSQNYLEQIGELVSKDNLPQAIKLLQDLMQNSPRLNEVLIQSARLSDISKRIRLGTIDSNEASLTKNQIRSAILELAQEIESTAQSEPQIASEIAGYARQVTPTHYGQGGSAPKIKVPNWMFGVLGLALVFYAIRFISQPSALPLQKVVVNLHGSKGIWDNPLKKGVVSIIAVEADFRGQSSLGTDGHAVFDAVPVALLGKEIACKLDSSPNYVLKLPDKKYLLAEKINVEIKKVMPPSKPKECPTTTPNNMPLGSDKPPGFRKGSTAVAGHYRVVNGQCEWVPGHWKKNDISDCPSQPPGGVNNTPPPKRGYTWVSGHYIKENGRCIWVSGHWTVVVPPERQDKPPAPSRQN